MSWADNRLARAILGLPPGRDATAREFLPAALEIEETPPSPAGRAIGATIIGFVVVAVAWAWLGRMDIVATAQGRVAPVGEVKVVQPFERGTVAAIDVRDGDRVVAGQVLVELDVTEAEADRDRIAADLVKAELDVARLTALRAGLDGGGAPVRFMAPPDASPADIDRARRATIAQAAEQDAKVADLEQQVAERQSDAANIAAEIAKLQASLPLVERQAATLQEAMETGVGSNLDYLSAEQKLVEQREELTAQRARLPGVVAARRALERQIVEARAEYGSKVLSDLADAQQKVAELSDEAIKAREVMRQQVLRAPVAGTVQQLAIHTVGGIVTPAQSLMTIVPLDSPLEVEATVSNRDIGFVHVGEAAEVKVETFDFTRYGLLEGTVTDLSRDAVTVQPPPGQGDSTQTGDDAAATRRPADAGPVYIARIRLARDVLPVDGSLAGLQPGMAVTVEIKTGRRRILDYFLSPLRRYGHDSLIER